MGLTNYDNWLADEGPDYCDVCGGEIGGAMSLDGDVCRRCQNEDRADRDNAAYYDEPEEELT